MNEHDYFEFDEIDNLLFEQLQSLSPKSRKEIIQEAVEVLTPVSDPDMNIEG